MVSLVPNDVVEGVTACPMARALLSVLFEWVGVAEVVPGAVEGD